MGIYLRWKNNASFPRYPFNDVRRRWLGQNEVGYHQGRPPDARTDTYKCVQSKPTTGEAYPSMWVDEDFVRANDFNNQYYHGIATAYKKDKSKPQEDDAMIADGIYQGKFNPGNYGKFFTGTRGTPCATKNSDC